MFGGRQLRPIPYGVKVIAWAGLPLLLATLLIGATFQWRGAELARSEASALEELMLTQKKSELEIQLSLVVSGLDVLAKTEHDPRAAQTKAKLLLASARSGPDGYFFVYDMEGTCVFHPKMPHLVGKELPELTHIFGSNIPEILRVARHGGGFLSYRWQKPSRGQAVEKLAYVTVFAPWNWIIGTGAYTDDIALATSALRKRSRLSANRVLWGMGEIALTALLLVFVGLGALNLNEKHLADQKQRDLTRRVVERGDEERARVARLLHDDLSQLLVAARYHFESVKDGTELGELQRQNLRRGLDDLSEAARTTRELSHELYPPELAELGLGAALASYVEEYRARVGISATFEDDAPDCVLSAEQSMHLFRIAQEALTNVARHSGATSVTVILTIKEHALHLSVKDNGSGFHVPSDRKERQEGIGLRSMRDRIEYLGGTLTFNSMSGETTITASLPLGAHHEV